MCTITHVTYCSRKSEWLCFLLMKWEWILSINGRSKYPVAVHGTHLAQWVYIVLFSLCTLCPAGVCTHRQLLHCGAQLEDWTLQNENCIDERKIISTRRFCTSITRTFVGERNLVSSMPNWTNVENRTYKLVQPIVNLNLTDWTSIVIRSK